MKKVAAVLSQRYNLLLREFGDASHTCRLKTIFEHRYSGSQNAFANSSFLSNANTSSLAYTNASFLTFLLSISYSGFIVISVHHSFLVFCKLNICKIRNFRYLKYLTKLLFLETFGNAFQLMPVFHGKKNFIRNRFAFALGLFESRENHESHAKHIVADFKVFVVSHRQVLNNFRAVLAEVQVEIQKTYGIELGNVEVIFLPFLCKVTYNHAKVKECSCYEMLLILNLYLHNKPSTAGILAVDVKEGSSFAHRSAEQFVPAYFHLFNGVFELFCEKGVQKKQKQVLASLVSECSFESEVQSERSELWMFETGFSGYAFRHNPPCGKKIGYKKNRSLRREYRKKASTHTGTTMLKDSCLVLVV